MTGFDSQVFLIVQERDHFDDFRADDGTVMPLIYLVVDGFEYWMPPEYDLLLSFEPIANSVSTRVTDHGAIKFTGRYEGGSLELSPEQYETVRVGPRPEDVLVVELPEDTVSLDSLVEVQGLLD
jgi:hypothetical protein